MRERLITWGLIVALAIGCVALWRLAGVAQTEVIGLRQDVEQLREAQRRTAQNVQYVEVKREVTRKELNDAVEQVPDWAGTSTPEPVVDVLCKRLRCQ